MNVQSCVELVLEQVPLEARPSLASNPIQAVTDVFALRVRSANHLGQKHGAGGVCDGTSFLEDGVLLYAPTPHSNRENFTILHELGHWLVDQDEVILSWLADQNGAEKLLETVCDRIAQKLLVPESAIDRAIGSGPLRAQHVIDLFEALEASQPACAIGIAGSLRGMGAVVIIDSYRRVVQYSSVKPDPHDGWPSVIPWPEQLLPDGHPLSRLKSGESTTERMEWVNPWGNREHFYVDALAAGGRVYAIFSGTDLWKAVDFHPNAERQFDKRLQLSGFCCGTDFEVRGYLCGSCAKPYCPNCSRCRCEVSESRERICSECCMTRPRHQLLDGICTECRD